MGDCHIDTQGTDLLDPLQGANEFRSTASERTLTEPIEYRAMSALGRGQESFQLALGLWQDHSGE